LTKPYSTLVGNRACDFFDCNRSLLLVAPVFIHLFWIRVNSSNWRYCGLRLLRKLLTPMV